VIINGINVSLITGNSRSKQHYYLWIPCSLRKKNKKLSVDLTYGSTTYQLRTSRGNTLPQSDKLELGSYGPQRAVPIYRASVQCSMHGLFAGSSSSQCQQQTMSRALIWSFSWKRARSFLQGLFGKWRIQVDGRGLKGILRNFDL
jgi:hypothetical protein